jgi:hypothetical protein
MDREVEGRFQLVEVNKDRHEGLWQSYGEGDQHESTWRSYMSRIRLFNCESALKEDMSKIGEREPAVRFSRR